MSCCNAKETIKAGIILVVATSVIDRYLNKDLSISSVVDQSWNFGKVVLQKNEKIRNSVFEYIGCKIREYFE